MIMRYMISLGNTPGSDAHVLAELSYWIVVSDLIKLSIHKNVSTLHSS